MQIRFRLKRLLIFISILLWSAQTLTTNSSFLSHQIYQGPEARPQSAPLESKNAVSLNISAPSVPTSSIKLSMTRTLSSLGMQAYSVVLSKDGKTAFVSTTDSGDVNILDVSNLNKITVIDVIRLIDPDYPFLLSMLVLSPDGSTLFVSNMQYLHLIDVSNPRGPRVLGSLKDQNLTDYFSGHHYNSKKYGFDYKISMAFSKDRNTLFISGLGLQVVDISNAQTPCFIDSNTDQVTEENLMFTEVRTSPSEDILYLANGTLNIFNISSPRTMKLLGSYSIEEHLITSVFLSEQEKNTLFIAGHRAQVKLVSYDFSVLFYKMDVRDPTNPLKIKSYDMICRSGGTNSYEYNYLSRGNVYIIGFSFNETIAYIFSFAKESTTQFGIFNLQKSRFIRDIKFLRDAITSVATLPGDDTKIIVAQNFDALEVLQFYTHYPNSRIYSSANTSIASLNFQFDFVRASMTLSPDSKILIGKSSTRIDGTLGRSFMLKIFNVSNPSKPQFMTSFDPIDAGSKINFLPDINRIILTSENISFLTLSKDLKTLELTQTFSLEEIGKLQSFQFSADGKIGYFICSHFGDPDIPEDAHVFRTVSFSSTNLKILSETNFTYLYSPQSLLTKDNRFFFIIGDRITVYDVSNPSKPIEVSSTQIDFHSKKAKPKLAYFSSDEKTIFTEIFDGVRYSLRIYDVENLSTIKLLSEMPLPTRYDVTILERHFAFSPDYKTAYVGFEKGRILAINMSNYNSPFVQGTFSLATEDDIVYFVLCRDGKTIFYPGGKEIHVAILQPPYTLFMNTETIRLGEKYSQPTALLKFNMAENEYDLYDDDYKFLKASLFDIKINKDKLTPLDCHEVSLPYWMNFDKENQILTLEPNKQEHIGTYTLFTAFSRRFPYNGFAPLNLARNKSAADDELLMTMMSLGYIDSKYYLTSIIDSINDFAAATPASIPNTVKIEMYYSMKKYYFDTFTIFDILPSLDVKYSDKIVVDTLSDKIRVEIELLADQNKFINKQYGSIKPTILGNRIILEACQKDINNALELLVINVEDPQECEGTVTINDRLNPVTTKHFTNISTFFNINQPPRMKVPIQAQINSQNIETGTYFTINFRNGTFVDIWNNDLSFDLVNGDPSKSLPSWISFSNMSLRGTPPDEIVWRDLKFDLIVRNEFKSLKIPFSINVRISPTFALKLLARYSPYILTVVGLIVYANKIYNIIFKRRYRYPRDFKVKIGEEITSSIIPPFMFIRNEKEESMIILKHLRARVARELGAKSIKDIAFAEYFANSEGTQIDNEKLTKKIKEILEDVPEKIIKKLDSYFNGAEESRHVIHKIIFNQSVLWLLEKNQETKKFFNMIKGDWIDLVEWDSNGMCKIKESQLIDIVVQADLHLENNCNTDDSNTESLIKEVVNVNLLRDAIESHAFSKQSIDHHTATAHVMIKFKIQKDFIRTFVKKDLEDVNFSDRGKMTYGIYFKVENDVLSFHGVPEKRFLNKTVVIQITTKKHRILNEIWIHGVSKNQEKTLKVNEEVARGSSYEVY